MDFKVNRDNIRLFFVDQFKKDEIKRCKIKKIRHQNKTREVISEMDYSLYSLSPNKRKKILEFFHTSESLKNGSGYIYMVSNGRLMDKNIVKIGFTKNLKQRIKAFNTYSPDNWKIIMVWTVKNAHKTEQSIHKLFRINRVNREFFRIKSQQQAYTTISKCIQQMKNKD